LRSGGQVGFRAARLGQIAGKNPLLRVFALSSELLVAPKVTDQPRKIVDPTQWASVQATYD